MFSPALRRGHQQDNGAHAHGITACHLRKLLPSEDLAYGYRTHEVLQKSDCWDFPKLPGKHKRTLLTQ